MSTLPLFNASKAGAARAAAVSAPVPDVVSNKEIAGAVTAGGYEGAGALVRAGSAPQESAAPAPDEPSLIARYEVTREWTTFSWLCRPCVKEKEDGGARVKRIGDLPPGFGCDRCELRRQGQLPATTQRNNKGDA